MFVHVPCVHIFSVDSCKRTSVIQTCVRPHIILHVHVLIPLHVLFSCLHRYGFASFMDSPLDPSATCADDDPRASALDHFQRINTPSTRHQSAAAAGAGAGRSHGALSPPNSSRPSSSSSSSFNHHQQQQEQHNEPLSPLSPETKSSSSSSAAHPFPHDDFATTSPSLRWTDAVLSSDDHAMHDAALNDRPLREFTDVRFYVDVYTQRILCYSNISIYWTGNPSFPFSRSAISLTP